ncbi:hypothetical protein NSP_70 [Nodularia spumigena CCY9414]|nr:hypothetical protein NSP_70 [Nodularia spumigena CCY9414]
MANVPKCWCSRRSNTGPTPEIRAQASQYALSSTTIEYSQIRLVYL